MKEKYNKLPPSIVSLTLTTQQKTKLSEITFWFADFKFLLKENIGISPGDYSEKIIYIQILGLRSHRRKCHQKD
jgi:hypothetical protein